MFAVTVAVCSIVTQTHRLLTSEIAQQPSPATTTELPKVNPTYRVGRIQALRVTEEIKVDGHLNEPGWSFKTESLKEVTGVSKVFSVLTTNRAFRRERATRVRLTTIFTGKIGSRLIVLAFLATLSLTLLWSRYFSSNQVVKAQTRRQQRNTRPKTNIQKRKPLLASSFKHETHRAPKTTLNCLNCHAIPARDFPDEIAAATKPLIKGYPYHDSCLECHRKAAPKFFSGATPVICTVCHTRVSPQATALDVYPRFPKQIDLSLRQLPGYFPHEKHREVISDLKKVTDLKQVSCADCHKKDERIPVALLVGGNEKSFTPAAGTFETSPDLPNDPPSAHKYCFDCHWETNDEAKKPSKSNCSGCHREQEEFAQKQSFLLLPIRAPWFKDWAREWPRRVSLKFRHDRQEHVGNCTTCHSKILETATLNVAHVSISSCSRCHNRQAPKIFDELEAEDQDNKEGRNNSPTSKEGKHTCTGCHTTLIGGAPPPCSHYRLDEDTYLSGDYPKLTERCKEKE